MLCAMTERLPGMVFDRYWPARHPGGTDYAQGRSLRVRRLYWLMALLGPLGPIILAVTRTSTRPIGAMAFGVLLLVAAGIFLWAMSAPAPPGGIYEVDEQGEPVEYLGKKPPLELRKTRGVTHEAFVASVKARR
jgi:hypothetical protein